MFNAVYLQTKIKCIYLLLTTKLDSGYVLASVCLYTQYVQKFSHRISMTFCRRTKKTLLKLEGNLIFFIVVNQIGSRTTQGRVTE